MWWVILVLLVIIWYFWQYQSEHLAPMLKRALGDELSYQSNIGRGYFPDHPV